MINLSIDSRLQMGIYGRKKVLNQFTSDIVNHIYLDRINVICNVKNQ